MVGVALPIPCVPLKMTPGHREACCSSWWLLSLVARSVAEEGLTRRLPRSGLARPGRRDRRLDTTDEIAMDGRRPWTDDDSLRTQPRGRAEAGASYRLGG